MKDYHNGPIENEKRKCTDLWCFIIFILFNLTMFGIGIYSWKQGSFSKLTTPYDPDGKGCGVDYPDYKFIYFTSPHVNSLFKTTCVKQCPKKDDSTVDCQVNSVVVSCSKNVQIYETFPFSNTICMPTQDTIKKQISSAIGIESIESKVSNLGKAWVVILICIPIAILLSIIFMLIIKCTAKYFVYILIFFSFIGLIAFGIFLLVPQQNPTITTIQSSRILSIVVAVICIALGLLIAVAFCCFRRRVQLAAAIVQVTADFVTKNLGITLLPIILFAIMILFIALWILQALGYYSLGTPINEPNQLPFQHFQISGKIKALGLVHLFYLFWGLFFLLETGDFIVSGAACSWYFAKESPYSQSSSRYLKSHIGSVSLGSFFLALFGFIKFLYELLTPDKPKEQGCLSKFKSFCDCCCFLCVSYIFKWFSSGAYTMIHLSGDSYCTSAFRVVSLKLNEPVATTVVMFMEAVFSLLVRVGITAITCAICYMIMKKSQPWKQIVTDITAPLMVIGAIAFTISSFFISIYSEGMSSIFVSYLADVDAGGKPQSDIAPPQLKQFIAESKKQNHIQ